MPQTTIRKLLLQAKQKIDQLDAELLIAHVLGKPREWVLTRPETKIERLKEQKIKGLLARRTNGEPIAYLTGHKEFFGLDFEVNKNVLIPRPETETMVELVIEEIKRLKDCKITMIDVGTGSGNIPIAIANHIRKSGLSVYPYNIIAIDISKNALDIAKRNAKKHGVKIKFLHGDLLKPFFKICNLKHITCNLIITANLPYLTQKQFNRSSTIKYEPKQALVAKNKGLALYAKLLKQIKQVTRYKLHVTSYFEIDPFQSTHITCLIKSILPTAKTQIIKDLSGLDRIVKICYTI